jgi:cytochrome P450
MTALGLRWDPYDVALDLDPHPTWRRLRDEQPLYRNDELDFWALSRFADVQAASLDVTTFSSSRGTVLELMGGDMSQLKMLIFLDPPEHQVLRSLVGHAFTPRRIAALAERIRQLCAECLDPFVGSGGFDYVADFGTHLPSLVISEILGVPPGERPRVLELIHGTFHQDPERGMYNDLSLGALLELRSWMGTALRERRARPQDDMLSVLAHAEIDDGGTRRVLDDEELLGFGTLLVSAGTETVARLLGWAATVLDDHPSQRAELAADPSLVPGAVEELLRFEAPSPVQGRTVLRPVELHGQVLDPGSKVLLLTGSAGRDERAYPDPDRFDIHRTGQPHLSLGVGAHYCLGAALARLEGRIALEETLRRFPSWTVDRERTERLHTSTVRGFKQVPIRL